MKKIISLSLAVLMLSMTAIVSPALLSAEASSIAATEDVFTYGDSKVIQITEADGTVHASELTKWTGSASKAQPDTDANGVYQIGTAAELAWFTDDADKAANAVLTNDIDLNGQEWRYSKGGAGTSFAGTFDGKNHTIYNLSVLDNAGDYRGGLFTSIDGGTVKNLKIKNAKIVSQYKSTNANSQKSYTAVLCGQMTSGTISYVSVSGTISLAEDAYANGTGSIVAILQNGTVEYCYSDVIIDLSNGGTKTVDYSSGNGNNYGVGGIVGVWEPDATESTIKDCGFSGTINAPYSSRVGGIVGNLKSSGSSTKKYLVTRCYNTGNITGYRQVAGIIGWYSNGTSGQNGPQRAYNTGNIVAKTATDSYAAGLVNGLRGGLLKYPSYSTGNVSVDEEGKDEFNDYCALLYTTTGTSNVNWDSAYAAYLKGYTYLKNGVVTDKHILQNAGTPTTTASHINGHTEAEFKNGTAEASLIYGSYTSKWPNINGVNNNYPVFSVQATTLLTPADTYYVADNSVRFTLDRAGYVSMDITPLGDASTVFVGDEAITKSGEYCIESDSETVEIKVDGKALITKELSNQKAGTYIDGVEAEIIRFSADTKDAGVVILALFDSTGTVLKKTKLYTSFENMTIDLRGEDVSDSMLKAFILKDLDTLEPVTAPYILDAKKTVSHEAGIKALDGKKVIFIGNSHVYYGRTVTDQNNSVLTQEARNNNKGGFYKLCKANGIDVSVTNWCFPGHSLYNIFMQDECGHSECKGKAVDHESYLQDTYYDYVFISPGSNNNGERFASTMDYIMSVFKEANPNVKFIILGHASLHGMNADGTVYDNIIGYFDELEEMGVTIANWGYIAKEAMNNGVDGSQRTYNKNTFVITKDGFHPNLLSGYLTTVTAYCAVTGEKAVDQPHSYVSDFNITNYVTTYYTGGDTETDFPEILGSEYEMKMFKRHIDKYLN